MTIPLVDKNYRECVCVCVYIYICVCVIYTFIYSIHTFLYSIFIYLWCNKCVRDPHHTFFCMIPSNRTVVVLLHRLFLFIPSPFFNSASIITNCKYAAMSKPNVTIYEGYPEISSVCECCYCSATVTMVRMRAEFVDSVARHRRNSQTFEQCLCIVLCVYNV